MLGALARTCSRSFTMLAVKQHGFGGREQLSLCELPRPTPKEGFVLVRVAAVSIHAGDHHMLTGRPSARGMCRFGGGILWCMRGMELILCGKIILKKRVSDDFLGTKYSF